MTERNKKMLKWAFAICAIVGVLFWNPTTRAIVLFLLPLGSGVDDFIVMAALLGAAVFGVFWFLNYRKGGF